jgi:hypothetical protein
VVAEVTEQVADLRELEPTGEVEVAFLDDDELTAELETILDRDLDLEDLAARTDVLVALRAVPPGPTSRSCSASCSPDRSPASTRPTRSGWSSGSPTGDHPPARPHHARPRARARHRRPAHRPARPRRGRSTRRRPRALAVIEGDATLLMNRWSLEHLSFVDQLGLAGAGDLVGQQEQLEAVPHHLARELVFPYTAGLDLVCDRWLEGGWSAVDEAYAAPPTTTAEVLFPERADEAPTSPPPLSPPPGSTERLTDTFGAAPLLWLFEAPGGDTEVALSDPADRVPRPGTGGEVQLWDRRRAGRGAERWPNTTATDPDLCASVTEWYEAAAPDADRDEADGSVTFTDPASVAVVRCDGAGSGSRWRPTPRWPPPSSADRERR